MITPKLDLQKLATDFVSHLSPALAPKPPQLPAALRKPIDAFVSDVRSQLSAPQLSVPQLSVPQLKLPSLESLFGYHHPEMDQFVKSTEDFRGTLKTLRETPPSDPRYAAAAKHLQEAYGYTPETAPKPGALWASPRLGTAELPNGQVTAQHYPTTGTPTTVPPKPMDWVFAYGRPPTIVTDGGKEVTLKTPEEYKAFVAENRARAGIKNADGSPADGEPKGVHLTMEGGGGLGKRYSPAFNEMYALGVVPTSVSGTSVGAIAAGYIAAGADPKTVQQLASDPALAKFFDFGLGGSGLVQGQYMYHYIDQKLRELTGIKDREVTFADLKIPCQIPATILSDSMPPAGKEDLSKPENRLFVFSQETTPNTPVVYAMLASGAFPGVLPTVDVVDPVSGRKLVLTDSGVIDGLPMKMHDDGLPEIGMSLQEPHSNHPDDHTQTAKPLPSGAVDSSWPVGVGLGSLNMLKDNATEAKDFRDRTHPEAGQFMLAMPIFDLDDARKTDKTLVFQANPDIDPKLDEQGRQIARSFFSRVLNDIGNPQAKATNLTTQVPQNLKFDTRFEMDGHRYTAQYSGGDNIKFSRDDGQTYDVKVGQRKVEAMYLDQLAFGSLNGELKVVLDEHFNPLKKIENELPF